MKELEEIAGKLNEFDLSIIETVAEEKKYDPKIVYQKYLELVYELSDNSTIPEYIPVVLPNSIRSVIDEMIKQENSYKKHS